MVRKIQAGDLLDGRFEVQDVINRSGMVSVHCAFDRELQQTITLNHAEAGFDLRGSRPGSAISKSARNPTKLFSTPWMRVATALPLAAEAMPHDSDSLKTMKIAGMRSLKVWRTP